MKLCFKGIYKPSCQEPLTVRKIRIEMYLGGNRESLKVLDKAL